MFKCQSVLEPLGGDSLVIGGNGICLLELIKGKFD